MSTVFPFDLIHFDLVGILLLVFLIVSLLDDNMRMLMERVVPCEII